MSPATAAGSRLLGAVVGPSTGAGHATGSGSYSSCYAIRRQPADGACERRARLAGRADGEVPSTSSASRDAAQCTSGLPDDSSDGPELNPS
mmetsp:Transcript_44108/g.115927  ORF Transcript_44108/g.115927 Transcript_44108/m.115927 type:complete len:91 (-) Transcript_44108:160-432(-)